MLPLSLIQYGFDSNQKMGVKNLNVSGHSKTTVSWETLSMNLDLKIAFNPCLFVRTFRL